MSILAGSTDAKGLPKVFAPSVSVELANPKPERPPGRA